MWIAILCALVAVILTRFLWKRSKYDLHKIPSPPGLPLLGHVLDISSGEGLRDPTWWMGKALKKLNDPKMMRLDVMGTPLLVVTDDHFIKTTMLSIKEPFPRHACESLVLPMAGNDPNAKNLSSTPTPTPYVKAVRKVYSAAMQSNSLKVSMPKIEGVMRRMLTMIDSKRDEPIEVQELLSRMTLDIIGVVAFDMNMGGLDRSKDIYKLVLATGYIARENTCNPHKEVYCKLFPNSKTAQDRLVAIEAMKKEWQHVTDEILSRDSPKGDEDPLWYGLRSLVDPETQKPIPKNSLLAEIAIAVIAGMDITGHQLAFIFALLASRPDVVDKILEELKQHDLFGEGARNVQFEDLADLTYLTAVIKEGLRVGYIGVMLSLRKTPKDMTILGYRVPKGTQMMTVGNRAFQVGTNWNDTEFFKPERWLEDDEVCHKHNMMFSTGPRSCAGERLAMLQMRIMIILLLTHYKISLVGTYEDLVNNIKTGLVIEAKNGIWLNMTPRRAS